MIILPFSVLIAQERLKTAFSSAISGSEGFLFSKYKYIGQVSDIALDVQFTVYGRSAMNYSMHGQLFPLSNGSQLMMIVKGRNTASTLLSPLMLIIFILNRDGVGTSIFAAIFFTVAQFAAIAWHRSSAADNLSTLIYKIVSNQS